MSVKEFFKNAFSDMKENAKAQHEVDKANFAAAKAESKANLNALREQESWDNEILDCIVEITGK